MPVVLEIKILLRDTQTGEEGWYRELWKGQPDQSREDAIDSADFYFLDGNGGCDCERSRLLRASKGSPDPNLPCGNERVIIVEATIDGQPVKWV